MSAEGNFKKHTYKIKLKKGRGSAEEPVLALDCFFDGYSGFFENLKTWDEDQMNQFTEELNCLDEVDVAEVLKSGDQEQIKEELSNLKKADKVKILEKLQSTGSIMFEEEE